MQLAEIKREIKNLKRTTFGISIPELKKFARQIARQDYKELLDNNNFETFELRLLHAFVLGYAKDNIQTLWSYFERFMPYVDDWATNDSLCQSFKIARQYPDFVWQHLMKYQNTHKEFESRIVSVMLLSHYLTDKYISKVIKVLDKLNTEEYYAQMGIAWAIATIMAKYPAECLKYLQSDKCHLNKETYNKSLRKIRESFRISNEIKEQVQKLKK